MSDSVVKVIVEPLARVTSHYPYPVHCHMASLPSSFSIAHLRLGMGMDRLLGYAVKLEECRVMVPAQVQHILHVHDVPSIPFIIMLEFLYSGDLPLMKTTSKMLSFLIAPLSLFLSLPPSSPSLPPLLFLYLPPFPPFFPSLSLSLSYPTNQLRCDPNDVHSTRSSIQPPFLHPSLLASFEKALSPHTVPAADPGAAEMLRSPRNLLTNGRPFENS